MTTRFRISISIEKRIILHLANYINLTDSFETNIDITQQGIAAAIGIRFQHVPRTLKNLLTEGLVYERKAHVKGFHRRKKIYFLNQKGLTYAKEINKWFDEKSILIRNLEGELREIKFNQLKEYTKFKLYPLEAFRYSTTSKNGVIDLNQVLSERKQIDLSRRKQTDIFPQTPIQINGFIFSTNVPIIDTFFGRDKELKTIQDTLESDTRIIVIHGIAGIGKTTLISKVVEDFKFKTNVFWYQFESWSSIKHVLKSLAEFLKQMGKKRLFSYFESLSDFDLNEVIDILIAEIEDINAILVFDDFHKSDKHTLDFFSSLKRLCEKTTTPKIIVITRSKLQFYDRRDVTIKKSIEEIQLTGLDHETGKKLLNIDEINDHQFMTIHNIVRGHPVALRLLDSFESIKHQTDFRTFIDEQVFNELNSNEKKLLNTACVFRYPVKSDALFPKKDKVYYNTLARLEQKFLIKKTSLETFIMHELLIDIYYKRLIPEQKRFYHKHAAEYYKDKKSDIEVMECIYHLINAHELKHAAKLIIEYGERLISQGYLEFFNLLEIFNDKNLPLEYYKEIITLKGDALIRTGNWDKALQHYEEGLELLEKVKDQENAATVYNKMGSIYGQMGDWKRTIELHEESLKIFKAKANKKGMAKTYNDLGMIYRQMEDYTKSLEMYKKSLKIFQEISEECGSSIIYLNIGRMYELLGKNKNAILNYKKGVKISEDGKYNQGIAFGYKFMGMYYYSLGKIDHAINYLQKSLKYFDDLKNNEGMIQLCTQLGEIYYQQNDYGQAIEMYKRGINNLNENTSQNKYLQKLFFNDQDELLGDNAQITLAKFYERIGNIYREQIKLDDAISYHTKHLNLVKDLGDDQETAMGYINIGIDHRKRHSLNQALENYNNALEKLSAINDKMGKIMVHRNIGKIYNLKGDQKTALLHFNISLDLSKENQYDLGIAKAYKEISKIYFKFGEKKRGNIYLEKAWRLLEKSK